MLYFEDKVIAKVNIPVDITENDICNIVVSCFEGGSSYWLGLHNNTEEWKDKPIYESLSNWATKLLLKGKEIKFYDCEDESNDEVWILTLEKLLNGIKLNGIKRPRCSDKNSWDAVDCDYILQYALFNDIMYD